MAGRYFGIPFAATGDKTTTPDAVQPDGSVSYAEGFGFDYERPNTDPAYKPVPRDGMNGLFYDITEAVGIIQKQGYADWSAEAAPYALNASVMHGGTVWISGIANNSSEPGADTNWVARSNLRAGTQAEVNEGTLGDVAVTPATLAGALSSKVLGISQSWENLTASRAFATTYTNSSGRPIAVSVEASPITSSSSKTQLQASVDSAVVSRSSVPGVPVGDGANAIVFFIVPSGSTYRVEGLSGSTLARWSELR